MSQTASPFEQALTDARLNRQPVIALRPEPTDPTLMDDVVVTNPRNLHMEMMSGDCLWIGVDLVNGDRICFDVFARKRGCLEFKVSEHPEGDYLDWDELYRNTRTKEHPYD